jgi:hypothetical protein
VNVVGLGFHPSQSTSSLHCHRIDRKICYKNRKKNSNDDDDDDDDRQNNHDNNNK